MKMTLILISIITIFIFSSCTTYRYIYAPATPNITYFTEKGDSKVGAYYAGAGGDGNVNSRADGYDIQGAYAITDHWMVATSYFNRNEKDKEYDNQTGEQNIYYKRNIIELGGGYFTALNEKKTITINLLASAGSGKFTINEKGTDPGSTYNRFYDVKVFKYYFQPSINFRPAKNFSFAFFIKPTFVRYGKFNTDYTADEFKNYGFQDIYNKTLSFFELGYDLKFSIPGATWLSIEAAMSGISRDYIYGTPLISRSGNAAIGLNVNFAKIPKKNKGKEE
ncbi:MAG: hypothetical protein ABI168_11645 [Ginsengibacter sp.]